MRLFATLGMAIVLCPALTSAARQTGSATAEPGPFEVDLTVDHITLDERGYQYGQPATPVRFTLKRTRTDSGWRLVMTADDTPTGPQRSTAPVSPFAGGRIEIDDDNSPPRLYNRRGDRVLANLPIPGFAAATAMQLTDRLVARATASAASARREALRRDFGPARQEGGGLERFARVNGERTEELIAEPETGLPREVLVTQAGEVQSRTTFEYRRTPTGDYVRTGLVTETPVPGRRGHRLVTRTTVTRVERREGR